MKQILKDYEIEQGKMTLYCDNLSAINIFKNLVQHSRIKHIDIRHHFIRDLVKHYIVTLEHMPTKNQLADLFTKPLDKERFKTLRMSIDMISVDYCLCVIVEWLDEQNFICISISLRATHLRSNDLKLLTLIVSRSCTWA